MKLRVNTVGKFCGYSTIYAGIYKKYRMCVVFVFTCAVTDVRTNARVCARTCVCLKRRGYVCIHPFKKEYVYKCTNLMCAYGYI